MLGLLLPFSVCDWSRILGHPIKYGTLWQVSLRINHLCTLLDHISAAQIELGKVHSWASIWKGNRRFVHLWEVRQEFESKKGSFNSAFAACPLLPHQTLWQFVPQDWQAHELSELPELAELLCSASWRKDERKYAVRAYWVDHALGDAKLGALHSLRSKGRSMVSV